MKLPSALGAKVLTQACPDHLLWAQYPFTLKADPQQEAGLELVRTASRSQGKPLSLFGGVLGTAPGASNMLGSTPPLS